MTNICTSVFEYLLTTCCWYSMTVRSVVCVLEKCQVLVLVNLKRVNNTLLTNVWSVCVWPVVFYIIRRRRKKKFYLARFQCVGCLWWKNVYTESFCMRRLNSVRLWRLKYYEKYFELWIIWLTLCLNLALNLRKFRVLSLQAGALTFVSTLYPKSNHILI